MLLVHLFVYLLSLSIAIEGRLWFVIEAYTGPFY